MIGAWTTLSLSFLSGIIAVFYMVTSIQKQKASKRMEPWFEDPNNPKRRSFVFLIGDRYDRSLLSESLRDRLMKANLGIKASEYAGICILIFAVLWVFNNFILNMIFPVDFIIAFAIVWGGSTYYLKSKRNKRAEDFNKQLPEVCRMMSNTIKAGLTLQQGIQMVSKEVKDPIGPEFNSMSHELRLGNSFEEVMTKFKQRVESKEMHIFVDTILIQRRVGGNLSEVLSLMAGTLEERGRVNQEVDTVTAESRYIAIVLPIVPIIMLLLLNFVIEGFINPLFTPFGFILIAFFVAFQLLGFFLIKRVAKIRV
ncbi:Flp pilus assembly protein TadB [Geomicrobium sp. JCM 19037]|uniref:type II secretion system F family protein n=1 Tax=Geomicrobium sp. JCM 19037 TaxID=1460634 RepID=UPI00045F41C8|nr:type II secretion system F family protein [Geomicrobium sp. JCM 19037]GAK06092.1 Flp pilus assembly protein TadB [Geomicrobium sp. JCM 19037]